MPIVPTNYTMCRARVPSSLARGAEPGGLGFFGAGEADLGFGAGVELAAGDVVDELPGAAVIPLDGVGGGALAVGGGGGGDPGGGGALRRLRGGGDARRLGC